MTYYEFAQSSGESTRFAVVVKPTIKDGILTATKVGYHTGFNRNRGYNTYNRCNPVKFIAVGNYTLEELEEIYYT